MIRRLRTDGRIGVQREAQRLHGERNERNAAQERASFDTLGRLNVRYFNGFPTNAASDLDLLAGKFACLFLACLVKFIGSLMIAISKDKLTSLFDAGKGAVFVIAHSRHVFKAAHAVADETDNRSLLD